MPFLTRLALRLTAFSERWVPGAFVIACLLTLATFGLALLLTGKSLGQCVGYWGDGFWVLLEFGMQMCLVMVTGSILADSPALRRGLDALARLPSSPRETVAWMALLSMALCWLHWGLGLIASALLVKRLIRRHPATDYRLLVAVAYFGMGAVWHAGLSGSAPLLVATPGHFLEKEIGLLPLGQTLFSPFNLGLVLVVGASLTFLAWLLYPSREHAFVLGPEALQALEDEPPPREARPASPFLGLVERSYLVCAVLGVLGLAYFALNTAAAGWALTLNKLNFLFFALGLLLHPSPTAFARSAERAAGHVHGVILQFPLYAGMYGIIKGSGLDAVLAQAFVRFATPGTFPLAVYWYSGVLNYFIPSGGSKFAVEAPYILEAAKSLGVPYAKTVLAYAWGDMLTDMIQPFWCLPLLAIARLEFKDILGYEAVAFVACALIGSAAFLLI